MFIRIILLTIIVVSGTGLLIFYNSAIQKQERRIEILKNNIRKISIENANLKKEIVLKGLTYNATH